MGKIINSTFVTLDGVVNFMEKWHFDFIDEESDALALEQLENSEQLLMGRHTYEAYAAVWPGRSDTYANRINAMPKLVVSSTLSDPAWENTKVIGSDLLDEVKAIRQQGGPVLMHGFGPVAKALLAAGLLDELHLWFHPALVGLGDENDRLHTGGLEAHLVHTGTRSLSSGVAVLSYAAGDRR